MEKEFIVLSNIEFENIKKDIKKDIERSYENIHLFLKEHQCLLKETQKVINQITEKDEEDEEDKNNLEKLYHDSKLVTAFVSGFFLSTIINFFFL